MRPTSINGLRKAIRRKVDNKEPVPHWMTEALSRAGATQAHIPQAIKQGLKGLPLHLVIPPAKAPRYKVPWNIKLGKASKGRRLTPEEIAAYKEKGTPN